MAVCWSRAPPVAHLKGQERLAGVIDDGLHRERRRMMMTMKIMVEGMIKVDVSLPFLVRQ